MITYLVHFRHVFSAPNFRYFQGLIIAFLLKGGRKWVTQIAQFCFFIDKSIASWEGFLAYAQWDMTALTSKLMRLVIAELGPALQYGSHYLIGIETTFAAKVQGRMLGVQKWKLATLLDHLPHQKIAVELYGEMVTVTAVVKDLWLRDVCSKVRVVVISAGARPIRLISTSLSLCAKEVIEIYGARFSIEMGIRELKPQMGRK